MTEIGTNVLGYPILSLVIFLPVAGAAVLLVIERFTRD